MSIVTSVVKWFDWDRWQKLFWWYLDNPESDPRPVCTHKLVAIGQIYIVKEGDWWSNGQWRSLSNQRAETCLCDIGAIWNQISDPFDLASSDHVKFPHLSYIAWSTDCRFRASTLTRTTLYIYFSAMEFTLINRLCDRVRGTHPNLNIIKTL